MKLEMLVKKLHQPISIPGLPPLMKNEEYSENNNGDILMNPLKKKHLFICYLTREF